MTSRLAFAVARRIGCGILLAALGACEPTMSLQGTVRDRQGTPLGEVSVTLQSAGRGPHITSTTNDGSFSVAIVGADPHESTLSFKKSGFKPLQIPVVDAHGRVDVRLESDPAS